MNSLLKCFIFREPLFEYGMFVVAHSEDEARNIVDNAGNPWVATYEVEEKPLVRGILGEAGGNG